MHGPTCIFWANLKPFSLQELGWLIGERRLKQRWEELTVWVGLYPIVTLEKQLLILIGNLV